MTDHLGEGHDHYVKEAWALAHTLPIPRRNSWSTGPGTVRSGRFTLTGDTRQPGEGLEIVWRHEHPGTAARTATVGCDDGSVWVETTVEDYSTEHRVERRIYDETGKTWHATEPEE